MGVGRWAPLLDGGVRVGGLSRRHPCREDISVGGKEHNVNNVIYK